MEKLRLKVLLSCSTGMTLQRDPRNFKLIFNTLRLRVSAFIIDSNRGDAEVFGSPKFSHQ
jgi:hypothetical protein